MIEARLRNESNNATAEALGMPRRTVDRAVNRVLRRAHEHGDECFVVPPQILILDIETAPILGYMWSLWKPVFGHNMMENSTYILSWAAKWVGEEEVMADGLCNNPDYSAGTENDRRMLEGIWKLLDEADFVVAHNGDKFDIKHLNTRFLLAGMPPPTPYKQIDTLKMVKRCFKFDTNRLDFLLEKMYGYGKDDAGGFETWRGCMLGDMNAWDQLISYNKGDVTKLERLYLDIRAWDKLHPSAATHGGTMGKRCCTTCGSENLEETDTTVSTNVSVFRVVRCNDCGTPMRERVSLLSPDERSRMLVRAR